VFLSFFFTFPSVRFKACLGKSSFFMCENSCEKMQSVWQATLWCQRLGHRTGARAAQLTRRSTRTTARCRQENASFAPLLHQNVEMPSFCQDRLGTNIGKTQKRDVFSYLQHYDGGFDESFGENYVVVFFSSSGLKTAIFLQRQARDKS
jgi:hypothetical protein